MDGFGKAKSGYSTTGAIGKGIGKGNKITNIPVGLEPYKPYLSSNTNVKWIKWQLEGKTYLDMAEQCPYCSGEVEEKKETILRVAEEYDPKTVEQLNKMLQDTVDRFYKQRIEGHIVLGVALREEFSLEHDKGMDAYMTEMYKHHPKTPNLAESIKAEQERAQKIMEDDDISLDCNINFLAKKPVEKKETVEKKSMRDRLLESKNRV